MKTQSTYRPVNEVEAYYEDCQIGLFDRHDWCGKPASHIWIIRGKAVSVCLAHHEIKLVENGY